MPPPASPWGGKGINKTMNTDWEDRLDKVLDDLGRGKAVDLQAYVATEKESSRKEGLEEAKLVLDGKVKKHEPNEEDWVDWLKRGYNQALTEALQKIQELINQ